VLWLIAPITELLILYPLITTFASPMLARTCEFGISEECAMPLMPLMPECNNASSLLSATLVFSSFACLI
jgi:hypothetical protein